MDDSSTNNLVPAGWLREFIERTQAVWDAYRVQGPGKVDPALFDGVDIAASALLEANIDGDLAAAVGRLRDLAQRCACRAEGLCFVTGEAGLIPRRDLHDAFEQTLIWLQARSAEG